MSDAELRKRLLMLQLQEWAAGLAEGKEHVSALQLLKLRDRLVELFNLDTTPLEQERVS